VVKARDARSSPADMVWETEQDQGRSTRMDRKTRRGEARRGGTGVRVVGTSDKGGNGRMEEME